MTFLENALKIVEDAANSVSRSSDKLIIVSKVEPQARDDILLRLKTPERVLEFEIVISSDDGREIKFPAWRVQWSSALGPYKGGIRFHPEANKDEVMALALLMTIKNAVAGLPYGGGKGAVKVDPRSLSKKELELLSREYVRHLFKYIGPDKDIPAPDVGTNPETMAWMTDEYSRLAGHWEPAAFTGKSVEKGGSYGREVATGFGGYVILREFVKCSNWQAMARQLEHSAEPISVAIQGFGNVGSNFAQIAHREGMKVIALSDSKGAIYHPDGLDVGELLRIQKERGVLNSQKCSLEEAVGGKCRVISNQELLELDVDVLVPAALENQITKLNAEQLKAKVILELANGPTTEEADAILEKKGIAVIPDILANAGGVAGSYFEWLQSKERKWWDEETVLKKIEEVMVRAFGDIKKMRDNRNISWRKAAYVRAVNRIAEAMKKAA